jgi:hypothetical protein
MNKELETIHVQGFKSSYRNFPEGELIPCEKPDFLIERDKGILGIEHKQIFKDAEDHGSSLQAQESLRSKLIKQVKKKYVDLGGEPISVYFTFNFHETIDAKQLFKISENISKLLLPVDLEPNELKQIDLYNNESEYLNVLNSILLHKRIGLNEPNFSPLSMGWTKELRPQRIINEIKSKEEKIDDYRKKCDEIWLLIVADDFTNASSVDLSNETLKYSYETDFVKLFFYWHFQKVFVELSTN